MSSTSMPNNSARPLPRRFFAAALVAGFAFAAWSYFVSPPAIPAFDRDCAEQCAERCQVLTKTRSVTVFVTDLGGIPAMAILAVMGAIWQSDLNRRFLALAWLGVVLGGGLLEMSAKTAFDRPRPPVELRDRAVLENNRSYPSGHSMGSTVGYGMLAYALLLGQPYRWRRIVIVLLLAGLVVAIGCSRVMLRAHWLSDVVAGWAIGLTWLCFCLGLIERSRLRGAEPA